MNALYLTVDGVVGTEPRRAVVNGQPLLSFRMVANERRFDNVSQGWVDVHSSWLSVSCFRTIARNAGASIKKGDRVIVHGKMRIKDYVSTTGERRTSVDVEASSIGHDLRFGTSTFEPVRAAEAADETLREQADVLLRELADLPQESADRLLLQRAALAPETPLRAASAADDVDDAYAGGVDDEGTAEPEESPPGAAAPRRTVTAEPLRAG